MRRFAGRLKGAATRQLLEERIHPMQKFAERDGEVPSMWSVKPWVIYLFGNHDVIRSVNYGLDNLVRARLAPQEYSFVIPYPGAKIPGAAHRR